MLSIRVGAWSRVTLLAVRQFYPFALALPVLLEARAGRRDGDEILDRLGQQNLRQLAELERSAYRATGMITAETAKLFAVVVAAMLVPNLVGARLYARFSDQTFRRLVLVLLLLSGIGLLTSATMDLVRGKII
jgi:hypothetical protein